MSMALPQEQLKQQELTRSLVLQQLKDVGRAQCWLAMAQVPLMEFVLRVQ
jgi:hypothetical protein